MSCRGLFYGEVIFVVVLCVCQSLAWLWWGKVFAAARPWQWGPGCPNQHWSNACVRSEDFKKYIIPGELIVRISLATLAFHPHFAMVSRRSSQVRGPSVISSSWPPKPVVCLSLLGGEGGDRQPGMHFSFDVLPL